MVALPDPIPRNVLPQSDGIGSPQIGQSWAIKLLDKNGDCAIHFSPRVGRTVVMRIMFIMLIMLIKRSNLPLNI